MIMNNESEKLSKNRKSRIERIFELDGKMKSLSKKNKSEMKKKNKILIKLENYKLKWLKLNMIIMLFYYNLN